MSYTALIFKKHPGQLSAVPFATRLLGALILMASCLMPSALFAEQPLEFRSHDPQLGYFYEVRRDEDFHRFLFVYRSRADANAEAIGKVEGTHFAIVCESMVENRIQFIDVVDLEGNP